MNWKLVVAGIAVATVISSIAGFGHSLLQERTRPRFPAGMDADSDKHVSRAEWVAFQGHHPPPYPRTFHSEDAKGSFPSSDHHREFDRVDCDRNEQLDWCEYKQLRMNLRWCDSPFRPDPWRLWRECLEP